MKMVSRLDWMAMLVLKAMLVTERIPLMEVIQLARGILETLQVKAIAEIILHLEQEIMVQEVILQAMTAVMLIPVIPEILETRAVAAIVAEAAQGAVWAQLTMVVRLTLILQVAMVDLTAAVLVKYCLDRDFHRLLPMYMHMKKMDSTTGKL